MKTIISGSRDATWEQTKTGLFKCGFTDQIRTVVSGHARGPDQHGERYARENSLDLVVFNANWKRWGKAAGPRRNSDMADYADALVAIWDGKSRGTKDMIDKAKHRGLRVYVYRTDRASTPAE